MTKSEILTSIIRLIPDPEFIEEIDLDAFEHGIRFSWSGETYSAVPSADGLIVSSANTHAAAFLQALLSKGDATERAITDDRRADRIKFHTEVWRSVDTIEPELRTSCYQLLRSAIEIIDKSLPMSVQKEPLNSLRKKMLQIGECFGFEYLDGCPQPVDLINPDEL